LGNDPIREEKGKDFREEWVILSPTAPHGSKRRIFMFESVAVVGACTEEQGNRIGGQLTKQELRYKGEKESR